MIVNLPKGDLHVHLNGAIPTNLVKELLAKNTNGIPSNFDIHQDLNILEPLVVAINIRSFRFKVITVIKSLLQVE
ncbi:hypothetical protein [Acinetobacter calcoaceticus]|uniref:hypothetical protein n=1 Tax=Acinetobacter calcoaceticus TaxID=471 RepID=UPI0022729940|nr:hypothetical protein [Acinetobacter calcoaceticus]GLG83316.1 hypothetical protein ACSO1_18380 [Acinetobacter calcoaceticus]